MYKNEFLKKKIYIYIYIMVSQCTKISLFRTSDALKFAETKMYLVLMFHLDKKTWINQICLIINTQHIILYLMI